MTRLGAIRLVMLALGATTGTARAGPLDEPPRPELFAHPDDRQRARLLMTPCTAADVGHGCSRFAGRLSRDIPCTYRIDAVSIGSIPTDQCYKMQAPRRFRGTWTDAFEGQAFVPDGAPPPAWPRNGDARSPGWRQQFDLAQAATIWLDVDRVKLPHDRRTNGRRFHIEFVGRETAFAGAYGHMGLSGNEIVVDRVIALTPID